MLTSFISIIQCFDKSVMSAVFTVLSLASGTQHTSVHNQRLFPLSLNFSNNPILNWPIKPWKITTWCLEKLEWSNIWYFCDRKLTRSINPPITTALTRINRRPAQRSPSNQEHSFPQTDNHLTSLYHFAVHWQFGGGSPQQPDGDSRCNEENQSKTPELDPLWQQQSKHFSNDQTIDGGACTLILSVSLVFYVSPCAQCSEDPYHTQHPLYTQITHPRKKKKKNQLHSQADSVGCQQRFESQQDSGRRFYGRGGIQHAGLHVIISEEPTALKRPFTPDEATWNTVMPCHYTSLQCYREAQGGEDLAACQLLDLI